MHFRNAFLASLVIFLATIVTAEKSTRASITDVANDRTNRGRLLRKVDVDEASAIETEERGILSSTKSWWKMQYWLAIKSDDEVKKALKMEEGLEGAALKNHPNYKKLETFRYKREGREMDTWLDERKPTQEVWEDLGLATMTAGQRKNSDEVRKYVRYATKFDDAIWNKKKGIHEHPIYFYGGSTEEMKVKVQIWVKANRPNWYVQEMRGLSKAELKADPPYQYFLQLKKSSPAVPNAAG